MNPTVDFALRASALAALLACLTPSLTWAQTAVPSAPTAPPATTPAAPATAASAATPARAASAPDGAPPTAERTLSTVTVTGSRISRIGSEGPSPVTVLKGEDLDRRGYRNVADALSSLTENTGFTQGEDFGNTFTPAANAISLRGLGPNHTLVLVNGRRVADYPSPYNGSVNFVNIANIPSALIDRIEVLSGGASAVYGSDAIAGVVNIVLKRQVDGTTVNLRAGATQRGGGENARAQVTSGFEAGRLSGVFGLELSARQPIWSRQRDFMSTTTAQGAAPGVVIGRKDASTGRYLAPLDGCDASKGLFQGSTTPYSARTGVYCGSGQTSPSFWTIQTGNRTAQAAGALYYDLGNGIELFAEGQFGWAHTENNTRGPSWTSQAAGAGYFRNANTGLLETWSRRFSPEEIGDIDRYNRIWQDATHNVTVGARGDLTGTWTFEVAASSSYYLNKTTTPRLLASVESLLLGPQLGTDADGVALFAADPARLYAPLTTAEFNSVLGQSRGRNNSWNQQVSASANGEWLQLPAGPLRAAVIAEAGKQGFSNVTDPRLGTGVFYNTTEGTDIRGTRDRFAVGAELNAPITQRLTATLAGRYDLYRFGGRQDGSTTYNAGLQFRPIDSLLLRAQHATSFRAPDMNYVFAAQTRGYYSSSTDYYRCQKAGIPLAQCDFADESPGFNFLRTGSTDLKSERGRSWGLGAVWQPSSSFDASLDVWKIRISDLVTDLDADQVLRNEADCRLGGLDAASPLCVDAISRVTRNPDTALVRPGEVTLVRVNPINAARESTWGFDLGARYSWSWQDWGRWTLDMKYTEVRDYRYQQSSGDRNYNQVGTTDFGDWPNKFNASLTWKTGTWTHTLVAERNGKIANESQEGFLPAYWNFNGSTQWQVTPATRVSLTINNLLNKIRKDPTATWPFYPVGHYFPYGRQGWIELEHRF
ncbi:TonB-dependent receptor domain-containing protein [Roseateles terrae]|uniref:Iron complex outermembrane receptor protein n=1 Tax=Roseateles terrae TaxID=431060 RepID=A0ABR6GW26_9BURK|nr:TonB-dependent receptor [Roseateles terrae]MBB3196310.1 iron complex outermembrane receptor protein [Roseateles terrae]